ncbi:sigma-70 family RNA polymerase sigma factor [Aquabacterium sp. A7-Y]|uniref:sigma-70 family RNA polymerase sigma factor n=1 Tax=Aquabacterium sp. A7-Y TaxID=1349605 RepID=UPI00223DB764|nr:sigma-70 family RNA polymerase sigma factor [Aquabacterium sp. A7-Y]MCW7539349.1 sigma-70 family RNA polymerase sigma factor [Aquabacterium sp. A7-Y]
MDDCFERQFSGPHRRRLTEFARGLLGNQADAEDVVQDAYLRARDSLTQELRSAEAWLLTVVRHLAIDRLRRRRLEGEAQLRWRLSGELAEVHCAPSAEQLAGLAMDSAAALRLLLQQLSPTEVAALLLREVFEVDYAEIARNAGRSESACRQLVHRALQRIRPAPARMRPAVRPVDDTADGPADVMFSLCWRALQVRSPAPLLALLAQHRVGAGGVAAAAVPMRAERPAEAAACGFGLVQIDGRFAIALMLDGKVLCTLPVGPCGESSTTPCGDTEACTF